MNIFITGTDTGVGKTIITAGIAGMLQNSGYKVGVFKPLQTGAEFDINGTPFSPDLKLVKNAHNDIITQYSYLMEVPAAPIVSAAIEKVDISTEKIKHDYEELCKKCDIIIVEGVGGLSVPIKQNFWVNDLIKILDLPTIIVARPNLGTINHCILTVEYAKMHNIKILGIIISGYPQSTEDHAITTAPEIIAKCTQTELLGIIPYINNVEMENQQLQILLNEIENKLNLTRIFNLSK